MDSENKQPPVVDQGAGAAAQPPVELPNAEQLALLPYVEPGEPFLGGTLAGQAEQDAWDIEEVMMGGISDPGPGYYGGVGNWRLFEDHPELDDPFKEVVYKDVWMGAGDSPTQPEPAPMSPDNSGRGRQRAWMFSPPPWTFPSSPDSLSPTQLEEDDLVELMNDDLVEMADEDLTDTASELTEQVETETEPEFETEPEPENETEPESVEEFAESPSPSVSSVSDSDDDSGSSETESESNAGPSATRKVGIDKTIVATRPKRPRKKPGAYAAVVNYAMVEFTPNPKLLQLKPPRKVGVRRMVPEEEKDEAYRLKRLKNKLCSRRSRMKSRELDIQRVEILKQQICTIADLYKKNDEQRKKMQVLENIIKASNIKITAEFHEKLRFLSVPRLPLALTATATEPEKKKKKKEETGKKGK